MARGRVLRPEEARLWHKIAKSTRPIAGKSLDALEKQFTELVNKPIETNKHTNAPKAYSGFLKKQEIKQKDEIANAKNHKRVRRGKLEIDAFIDLHGFNQEMAQARLYQFIENAIANQFRTLLVITGKGQRHEEIEKFDLLIAPRGIIRKRLKEWLHIPHLKNHIAGISEAHLKHGGSGAFYILLKAPHSQI